MPSLWRAPVAVVLKIVAVAWLVAACGPQGSESAPGGTVAPSAHASTPPDPEAALAAVVTGPWRPAPGVPVESLVDPVIAACRAATVPSVDTTRAKVGDLPVAVVDVRGGGRVSVVFADPAHAVVCQAPLDDASAPVVRALRWQKATAPSPGPKSITIKLLEVIDEATAPRSLLVGEVGSQAFAVKDTFADDSHIQASMGGGWYVMWWPGADVPTVVSAVDNRSIAIGGVHP
jgi:hypothetical protein